MSFNSREEHYRIFIIIFLILTILPFFVLCFFNHPCPEDMSWTENAHRNGFIKSQLSVLNTEGGRYFTYAFLSLNPLIFHSITGYKILVFLLMAVFLYSMYLFIKEIFQDTVSLSENILISVSVFFLYLYGMPAVGEGFYYLTGVALYNLSLILLMLFSVCLIRFDRSEIRKQKIIYGSLSIILFLMIMGTCELAIALLSFLILLVIVLQKLSGNSGNKINKLLPAFLLLIAVAGFILYFSPGNQHRSDKYSLKHEFIVSAYNSFTFTVSSIYYWLFKTPLSGITILLIPVFFLYFKRLREKDKKVFPVLNINPVILLPVSLFILTSLNFIIFYSINIIPYYRIQNFIYFVFLILWFYNSAALCSYLPGKIKINAEGYSKYFYAAGIIIVALFLYGKSNSIRTAYSELIRGTASEYDSRMNERYKTIYECGTDSCQVDSIKNVPKTLSEVQLTSDPMSNFNRWYSRYFHKKYVYLRK